jgi:beta-barrel assembly-enhancing protease
MIASMSVSPPRAPRRAGRAQRACAALLALLMVLPAAPLHAQVRLPALGETASEDLTVGDERRIGEAVMREARRDPLYLDDPVLLEYLQSLWQPLLAAARKQGEIHAETERAFAWEAFLVKDRSVNAFAMPGGFVGMHLGLIALTTTSDQMASVLAHELAHVTQRHIARSIAPQRQASLVAMAAMILGVLAASRTSNIDAANAAIATGQAAAIQGQLNYSRDAEREADRVGFGLLSSAGFAPAGMAAMFEKMDIASRLNDSGGYPYLRSHPLTVDRLSESRNRTLLSGGPPSRPTVLHALMQGRARVLMDDSTQSLLRLNGASSSPLLADRVGAAYAGALAAMKLRDAGRAQQLATEAQRLAAGADRAEPAAERVLNLLQAQLAVARGEPTAALQWLQGLDGNVGGRPALLLRAQALLDLNRTPGATAADRRALRDSTEALQTWVAEQPADALAWEQLAAGATAAGLTLRGQRAAAEARAALGDLQGAIDRLRAAQQTSRGATGQDFIEASVIDARLRQLLAQRRQLQLEAREARGGGRGPEREGEAPPPQ